MPPNVTMGLQLQESASNLQALRTRIQTQLTAIPTTIDVKLTGNASLQQLANIRTQLQQINTLGRNLNLKIDTSQLNQASNQMHRFGELTGLATKRFAAFVIGAGGILTVTNLLKNGIAQAISFQNEMVRLSQVTRTSTAAMSDIGEEVTRLSKTFGVSSKGLIEVASTLAQAGLSARETKTALEALAKTQLAPSFDDIKSTTEGAISAMAQFGLKAKDLESVLGSINAVAAATAVESRDLVEAIKRAGGTFKAISGDVGAPKDQLNQLIALFTSVRATTRESADEVATGLRTIFGRIERPATLQALDNLGIKLTDTQGKFVGAYKAVEILHEKLGTLDTRNVQFGSIVEDLGGTRQLSRLIPLIQQYPQAARAYATAQAGVNSLNEDAVRSGESWVRQIAKIEERFLALVRDVSQTSSFKAIASALGAAANAALTLGEALKPLIPLLTIIGGVKLFSGLSSYIGGVGNALAGRATGRVQTFASGGYVHGVGGGDHVPALLTPGERVLSKGEARRYAGGGSVYPISKRDLYPHIASLQDVTGLPFLSAFQRTEFAPGHFIDAMGGGGEGSFGYANVKSRNIRLRQGLGLQDAFDTFLHESGHLADTAGLAPGRSYNSWTPGSPFNAIAANRYGFAKELGASSYNLQSHELFANDFASLFGPMPDAAHLAGADMNHGHYVDVVNHIKRHGFAGGGIVDKVKALGSTALKVLFAPYRLGQSAAEQVALAKGASPEQAAKLRSNLFKADLVAGKGAGLFGAAHGMESAGFIPWASTGYIAKSAWSHPKETGSGLFNLFNMFRKGEKKFAEGGPSGTDTIPAWLSPGEFVFSKKAVDNIGAGNLSAFHNAARFFTGGFPDDTKKVRNPFYSKKAVDSQDLANAANFAAGITPSLGAANGAVAQLYHGIVDQILKIKPQMDIIRAQLIANKHLTETLNTGGELLYSKSKGFVGTQHLEDLYQSRLAKQPIYGPTALPPDYNVPSPTSAQRAQIDAYKKKQRFDILAERQEEEVRRNLSGATLFVNSTSFSKKKAEDAAKIERRNALLGGINERATSIGRGLGVGALFGSQYISPSLGPKNGAVLQGGAGGAFVASEVGGAVGGLAGSAFGPAGSLAGNVGGRVIGAFVGAIAGANDALAEFKKKTEDANVAKLFESLDEKVEKYIKSGIGRNALGNNLEDLNAGLLEQSLATRGSKNTTSRAFGNAGSQLLNFVSGGNLGQTGSQISADISKEIFQDIAQNLSQGANTINVLKNDLVGRTNSIEEFSRDSIGKGVVGFEAKRRQAQAGARGNNISIEEATIAAKISIHEDIEASKKTRDLADKLTKLTRVVDTAVDKFEDISNALNAFSDDLNRSKGSSADISAAFGGNFQYTSPNYSQVLKQRASPFNGRQFNEAIDAITAPLGAGGNELKKFANDARQIELNLKPILTGLLSEGPSIDLQSRFNKAIDTQLGGISEALKQSLKVQFEAQFGHTDKPEEGFRKLNQNLDAVAKEMDSNVLARYKELAPKIAEAGEKFEQASVEALNKYNQASNRIADLQGKQADNFLGGARARAAVNTTLTGIQPNLPLSVLEAPYNARLNAVGALDRNPARLQNVITNNIDQLKNNNLDLQTRARLTQEIGNATKGLELLANSAERNAGLQEKLAKAEQNLEARKSLGRSLLGGSYADIANTNVAAASATAIIQQFKQGGNIFALPEQIRTEGVKLLEGPFRDIKIAAAGGRTGGEVLDQILHKQGIPGVGPSTLFGGASPNEALKEVVGLQTKISENFDEAAKALEASEQVLVKEQGQYTKDFQNGVQLFQLYVKQLLLHEEIQAQQAKRGPLAQVNGLLGGGGNLNAAIGLVRGHFGDLEKLQGAQSTAVSAASNIGLKINAQGLARNTDIVSAANKIVAGKDLYNEKDLLGLSSNKALQGTNFEDVKKRAKDIVSQQIGDEIKSVRAANTFNNVFGPEVTKSGQAKIDALTADQERLAKGNLTPELKGRVNEVGRNILGAQIAAPVIEGVKNARELQENISGTSGLSTEEVATVAQKLQDFKKAADIMAAQGIQSADSIRQALGEIDAKIKAANAALGANQQAVQAIGKAAGGSIFASRGSDTVPAMLTPGEFVVNAGAASRNAGVLNSINSGAIYRAGGGWTSSADIMAQVDAEMADEKVARESGGHISIAGARAARLGLEEVRTRARIQNARKTERRNSANDLKESKRQAFLDNKAAARHAFEVRTGRAEDDGFVGNAGLNVGGGKLRGVPGAQNGQVVAGGGRANINALGGGLGGGAAAGGGGVDPKVINDLVKVNTDLGTAMKNFVDPANELADALNKFTKEAPKTIKVEASDKTITVVVQGLDVTKVANKEYVDAAVQAIKDELDKMKAPGQ